MSKVNELSDSDFQDLLLPVWEFLAVEEPPIKSDVIFVFGGLDKAVPLKAAKLFIAGWSKHILVSGSVGPFTKDVFDKSEALVFKEIIVENGVPESAVIIEDQATNALENVLFGMKVLNKKNIPVKSALLIAKPFMMRRSLATFQKQCQNVSVRPCPPTGDILSFCDRYRNDFAGRLLAELTRLKVYSDKGDIAYHPVPKEVQIVLKKVETYLQD